MSAFDSGNVKLDATEIRMRSFAIRLSSAERMIALASKIAAETPREGAQGEVGPRGPQGPEGPEGPPGPPPQHEWHGTQLRFENSDGTWGPYVDLQGPAGQGKTYVGAVVQQTNGYFPSGW